MLMTHQVKKEAFMDDETLLKERGDHFEVRWTVKKYFDNGDFVQSEPKKQCFVFQKDKNRFMTKLLNDDSVYSIDVGTFNKIK